MLVLGRKVNQNISIPDLGIKIRILRVKGASVRVGIDAPTEFRILRDELNPSESMDRQPRSQVFQLPQSDNHSLRNQLNELGIALHLFKAEVDAGQLQDAEATFEKLVSSLQRASISQVVSHHGAERHVPQNSEALLVEDQANEREMLAGFLRMRGYSIATVSSGSEAMEYLESNEKPRLMLIDMGLPGLDGASTIRLIRETPAMDDLQIYGLSGSSIEEVGLSFEEQRINGWFMKPLNPESLVDMLSVNNETESMSTAV